MRKPRETGRARGQGPGRIAREGMVRRENGLVGRGPAGLRWKFGPASEREAAAVRKAIERTEAVRRRLVLRAKDNPESRSLLQAVERLLDTIHYEALKRRRVLSKLEVAQATLANSYVNEIDHFTRFIGLLNGVAKSVDARLEFVRTQQPRRRKARRKRTPGER